MHSDTVGGNLVNLIKQEQPGPSRGTVTAGIGGHGGLPSWSEMQQGGKRKSRLSDHLEGGSQSKRYRVRSGSDSDSDGSCSSQLGADQENLLFELLEDSAPDSTTGPTGRRGWQRVQRLASLRFEVKLFGLLHNEVRGCESLHMWCGWYTRTSYPGAHEIQRLTQLVPIRYTLVFAEFMSDVGTRWWIAT